MKHHFGDLLDRTADYWTIVPNRERYAYSADQEITHKEAVKILTISNNHKHWEQVFACSSLEELTLHNPSKAQVEAIQELKQLKRLRISFFRANNSAFIGDLPNLEELILEYVSGFSDLSPLQKLTKLKAVHFENLRKVTNFDGLRGLNGLRYLYISGTLDWNQPIDNFSFLGELPNLELLALGFVTNKSDFPAFLPLLALKKLKRVRIGRGTLATKEYAFLETALSPQRCGDFSDTPWTPCYELNHVYIEFIGKKAGNAKKTSSNAGTKVEAFLKKYEEYKDEATKIIAEWQLRQ